MVDTRGTSNVNLDKYDEKLDKFVPEAANLNVGKQKIKKKNTRDQGQQDRRNGGRGRNDQRKPARTAAACIQAQARAAFDHRAGEITVGELAARMKISAGEVTRS